MTADHPRCPDGCLPGAAAAPFTIRHRKLAA
ncbi:hypothetical protein ACSSVZ_002835 [Amorphus sp. MBR-141]